MDGVDGMDEVDGLDKTDFGGNMVLAWAVLAGIVVAGAGLAYAVTAIAGPFSPLGPFSPSRP